MAIHSRNYRHRGRRNYHGFSSPEEGNDNNESSVHIADLSIEFGFGRDARTFWVRLELALRGECTNSISRIWTRLSFNLCWGFFCFFVQ